MHLVCILRESENRRSEPRSIVDMYRLLHEGPRDINTTVKRLRMRELSGEEVEEHQLMMMMVHRTTSLPMVVDCSDTSLVGILHNFIVSMHCCLLCFLALVLDGDNNSCKDI